MKYSLINPAIKGEFNVTIKASNADDAAKKFWSGMSRYFTNNLSSFPFTVMNSNGELSHYITKEKVSDKTNVEYTINRLKINVDDVTKEKLVSNFNKIQSGGKKHRKHRDKSDSDDDSSSSSSSYHIHHHNVIGTYPIVYWDYYPTIYHTIDVVSVPTWVTPLAPAMNVWLI